MPGTVYFPFNGTTDGSGNASVDITNCFTNGEYAAIAVTLAMQGSPYIVITIDNGHIIGSGGGPNATIKAVVPPTQSQVILTITNGPVSATFTATVNGWSDENVDLAVGISGASSYGAGQQLQQSQIDTSPFDFYIPSNQVLPSGGSGPLYGPIPVSGWNSFIISSTILGTNPVNIVCQWYHAFTDIQGGLGIVAERNFTLDQALNGDPSVLIIPNYGPFLYVYIQPHINNQSGYTFIGYRSQRLPAPTPWAPAKQMLAITGTVGIPAATPLVVPGDFAWGGVLGYRLLSNGAQPGSLGIGILLGSTFNYRTYYTANVAAGNDIHTAVSCPEGWHQFTITNTGAGTANFTFECWPIVTGGAA